MPNSPPYNARRESREIIGRAVALAIAAAGARPGVVAQRCGINGPHLSSVTHGTRPLSRRTARRVSEALEHAAAVDDLQPLDGDDLT